MTGAPSFMVKVAAAILRPAIRMVLDEQTVRVPQHTHRDVPISWESGRRPAFWSDVEVRNFLIDSHRQMTLGEAVSQVRQRFGSDRTPSRSAVGRLWQILDAAHGNGGAS